jgi:hypothetical protein
MRTARKIRLRRKMCMRLRYRKRTLAAVKSQLKRRHVLGDKAWIKKSPHLEKHRSRDHRPPAPPPGDDFCYIYIYKRRVCGCRIPTICILDSSPGLTVALDQAGDTENKTILYRYFSDGANSAQTAPFEARGQPCWVGRRFSVDIGYRPPFLRDPMSKATLDSSFPITVI